MPLQELWLKPQSNTQVIIGCDRCTQRGAWYGRLTYQDIDNLVLRTNQTFRDQVQEHHHCGVYPFTALPVDLIKSFSVDYMHQACLGVMRRLLLICIKGKRETRLTTRHVEKLSEKLLEIQQFVPREFVRKPRGLQEIDRWKATEFRQFCCILANLFLKAHLEVIFILILWLSQLLCAFLFHQGLFRHIKIMLISSWYSLFEEVVNFMAMNSWYTMSIACFTLQRMLVGLEA